MMKKKPKKQKSLKKKPKNKAITPNGQTVGGVLCSISSKFNFKPMKIMNGISLPLEGKAILSVLRAPYPKGEAI